MTLMLSSVPDLTGGVSQQPVSQRGINQCQNQVNAMPLTVGGLIKRPPLNHVGTVITSGGTSFNNTNVFTHFVRRDNNEEFIIICDGGGNVLVNDLNGVSKTVIRSTSMTDDDNYLGDLEANAADITDPIATLRAFTIGDVTFLVNTSVTPAMSTTTGVAPFSRLQASAPNEALLILRSAGIDIEHKVRITIPDASSSGEFSVTFNGTAEADADVTKLAEVLATGTTAHSGYTGSGTVSGGLNGIGGISATAKNGVIHLVATNNQEFSIECFDSLGDAATAVVREDTPFFSDLPSTAPHMMIVRIVGSSETEIDDYYLRFEVTGLSTSTDSSNTDAGTMGKGRWIECPKPGIPTEYDFKTMPHILVRQPDDTFVVTLANGEVPIKPVGEPGTVDTSIEWSTFRFTNRTTGDTITNTDPSFIGQPITDISFFRNRLVITSGENISLSEVGFYFNFFRTTVRQLLDSETIDVGVGGTDFNVLKRVVPFSDRLVLLSDRAQFVLQGEAILSPLTVSVTNVTDFDVDTGAAPVTAGTSLFFPFARGSFSGFREYFKAGTAADNQFDSLDITEQVPKFIEGSINRIATSTHENLIVVQAASKQKLYVYKYENTSRGKTQSAWFTFDFSLSSVQNCQILNFEFVGTSLFVILNRDGKTFIERMDLQTGLKDDNSTYVTTLDRRFKIEGTTSTTETTSTFVIPAVAVNTALTYNAVTAAGEVLTIAEGGVTNITINNVEGTQIVISKALPTDTVIYFGLPYTMTYEFTRPLLKRTQPNGRVDIMSNGRHQIRYMTVEYDASANFTIRVTPQIGTTSGTPIDYPFSGRFLAQTSTDSIPDETGSFRIPVFQKSQNAKIEIINSSALPSNIQSAEFEAEFTTRIEQQV